MKRARQAPKKKGFIKRIKARLNRTKADWTHWSESSQRSAISFCHPPYYEDIDYVCTVCGHDAVFSEAEQKEAYEIKKRYIWERRHLCKSCYLELRRTQRKLRDCRLKWERDKAALRRDAVFLRGWLDLLEAYPRFGPRRDAANIRRLEKLLAALAAPPS